MSTTTSIAVAELRDQVFDRLVVEAQRIAADPREFTTDERCLRTVHATLDVLSGGAGHDATGEGLPRMQLLLAAHPDYEAAREVKGLPVYENHLPFDSGLPSEDYNTGLADAFENRVTAYHKLTALNVKDLFD